jgi:nucleotide-binding universal stress UspA family protein
MRALLAVDDSEASHDAAAFAHRILDHEDDIIVLNVARLSQVGAFTMGGLAGAPGVATATDDTWEAVRRNSWRLVTEAGEEADADEGRVEIGDPGQRICDVAAEEGVELIVMGSRDRGLLERIFSPSVSAYVVSHAPCSVLVVR